MTKNKHLHMNLRIVIYLHHGKKHIRNLRNTIFILYLPSYLQHVYWRTCKCKRKQLNPSGNSKHEDLQNLANGICFKDLFKPRRKWYILNCPCEHAYLPTLAVGLCDLYTAHPRQIAVCRGIALSPVKIIYRRHNAKNVFQL